MTILIGYKSEDKVMLTGDRMSSQIDYVGTLTGPNSSTDKISIINPKAMLATGGVSQLGLAVKSVLENTVNFNLELTKEQMITIVRETLQYCHGLFVRANPNVIYTDLGAYLGGYEDNMDSYFLVGFSNVNNFTPVECPNNGLFVFAPSTEIEAQVRNYVSINSNRIHNNISLAGVLSESIRNVNDPSVSNDTLSLSFSSRHPFPQHAKFRFDEEGNFLNNNTFEILVPRDQLDVQKIMR